MSLMECVTSIKKICQKSLFSFFFILIYFRLSTLIFLHTFFAIFSQRSSSSFSLVLKSFPRSLSFFKQNLSQLEEKKKLHLRVFKEKRQFFLFHFVQFGWRICGLISFMEIGDSLKFPPLWYGLI